MSLKWQNICSAGERSKRFIKASAGFLKDSRWPFLNMTLGVTLCTVIFFAPTASAANYRVERWRVIEIALTSSVTYTDPFQDVDVTATFTGPDKKTIIRPAY